MFHKKPTYWLTLLLPALLASCGSPGVPLPPSLQLARPVTDLRAVRKGDEVHLTWTIPTQTTEHQNLRHNLIVEICRAEAALKNCGTPLAQLAFQPVPRNASENQKNGAYTDHLSSAPSSATSNFVYAVSVMNSYHRSAGLSNQVGVPSAPTLAPPRSFRAELNDQGVQLSWDAVEAPNTPGLSFVYRVYRRDQVSNADAIAGEIPVQGQSSPGLLDRSFEWEKTYSYRMTVVTVIAANGAEKQVEGDDSPPVQVIAHDVFPPAIPAGLQAVFSGPGQKLFIDLVWTPDTEPDLAGYNVYRHEQDGQPAKLNSDLVKSPAYRDTAVSPGHQYSYSVSAVDVRGNESSRSEEASETVPEN
jgi:hypothetical protein